MITRTCTRIQTKEEENRKRNKTWRRSRRRRNKEYKGRTDTNNPTGPNEVVCVARYESFNTTV